jgi:hypothetical protein
MAWKTTVKPMTNPPVNKSNAVWMTTVFRAALHYFGVSPVIRA